MIRFWDMQYLFLHLQSLALTAAHYTHIWTIRDVLTYVLADLMNQPRLGLQ